MQVPHDITEGGDWFFDPDDGLPLAYPGEREPMHDPYFFGRDAAEVAEHKI